MNSATKETVYLALGANLGDRAGTMDRAVAAIGALPGVTVEARSAWQSSAPVGGPVGQPDFLNGAARLTVAGLEPAALLVALKRIETELGRDPDGERWGPRLIDLDILLFGDRVIDRKGLTIPHPRMAERRFVLEPLCEISESARHPIHGKTVEELLGRLEEKTC